MKNRFSFHSFEMRFLMMSILCFLFVFALSSSSISQIIEGCGVFPANNIWNAPVDNLPLDPHSADYINTIGSNTGFHPDFGAGLWNNAPIGIPFTTVPGSQPLVAISFTYSDESDPGPYPIPENAPIEGGANSSGDRHVLIIDKDNCKLYEIYKSYKNTDGTWRGGSGAVYDLNSNALRPDTWTSADAAGLPIFPGLVRYEEVAAGEIKHIIRFTCQYTQKAYIWPARHYASSSTDVKRPPMGQRFRLKKSFNTASFSAQTKVILEAMKKYGIILADNGSDWYLSGIPNESWDNDNLVRELKLVKGSDMEAVDCSGLMENPDSGKVKFPGSDKMVLY